MKEDILQFAWESRSFDARDLQTSNGSAIRIVHPGLRNSNQGPDFLNATIEIDKVRHRGHVEIHVDARDWYRHGHHKDKHYNPVILHVVLSTKHKSILRQDQTEIPEVCLGSRLSPVFLERGSQLLDKAKELPCSGFVRGIPEEIGQRLLDNLGRDRMAAKVTHFCHLLRNPALDWMQLLWEEVAAGFGGRVNREVFREMARRLPYRVLRRYASIVPTREALLFGMCGYLSGPAKDEYHDQLQEEWRYLEGMHRLPRCHYPLRYHRMRPGGLPQRRLSQLGHFIVQFPMFSDLLTSTGINRFLNSEFQVSRYWETHDNFGQPCQPRASKTGRDFRRVIALNTLIPLGIAYAEAHGNTQSMDLLGLLPRNWPSEKNKVVDKYSRLGFPIGNAREGQGVLQLEQRLCRPRKCLECSVGRWILGK